MVVPGTIFEELGFHYTGPVDGHNLNELVSTLREIKKRKGPRLLHVITTKGKGYHPAEENPERYHAVKAGFHTKEITKSSSTHHMTYSQVFGQWIYDMATRDDRLVGITPAMCRGSGMEKFATQYKDRFYDVGIAEQHATTLAAGLACGGKKPVVAIYSTFLQRAYDQVIHDVALQNLDVTFAIDRAGLVGPDGPTHAGSFDLSFLRCVPNLVIMAPADENECYQMLNTAYHHQGPAAVRYPKGFRTENLTLNKSDSVLPLGEAKLLKAGKNIALLAFGRMVDSALAAGDQLNATVYNMRFIKPLDTKVLQQVAKTHRLIVTIEENAIQGGAGSAINEYLLQKNIHVALLNLGLPDQFISHGSIEKLLAQCGLHTAGIIHAINDKLKTIT
jgi:1-deoxy-D-xylulose-5-phosphate synthase